MELVGFVASGGVGMLICCAGIMWSLAASWANCRLGRRS